MAGLEIADLNREVPVATELRGDLPVQPALVVFDRQEQACALLGGELKNAGEICNTSTWISTPSSSRVLSKTFSAARSWDSQVSNEVCAIATPSSQASSETLGDKPHCAIGAIGLRGRSPQGFANRFAEARGYTDQLIKILVLIGDLGNHPLPEQPKERLELYPLKQIEEGGVAVCLGQLQIQGCGKRPVMALDKTLQISGAAAAAEDAKDRHQQQQPLRVAETSALAAFRQRLQEGDQISSGSGVDQRTRAVPTKPAPAWPQQPTRDGLSVGPGCQIGSSGLRPTNQRNSRL